MRRPRPAHVAAALLGALTLAPGLPRAVAADLETVRERAQRVADEVTALERRLQGLRERRAVLEQRITASTQRIAALEVEIHATEAGLEEAQRRYTGRAVEAYKDGPTSQVALLLSSRDLPALLDAAEALGNAAEADVRALEGLLDAIEAHERVQREIDRRKQELLAARAQTEEVVADMAEALAARRTKLAELNAEIARLEEQARREAARAAQPSAAFAQLLAPAGPAAAIPDGYVGTGVTFEGIASWYGPGFEGETTASGAVFDPDLYTAASRDLPFGTLLFVSHGGRGVVVVINDRGPFIEERILDLSQAAAEAIGLGLGWVVAEIVVPAPG
jgi:rare lipoprotein A (peptidoglycan hydrolase)